MSRSSYFEATATDGLTHPQHELARILELVECVTLEVGEAHGTEILDPFPTPCVLPNPRHRLFLLVGHQYGPIFPASGQSPIQKSIDDC